jgi:uncharacterized protein YwgA
LHSRSRKDSLEDQLTLLILLRELKEHGFQTKRLKLQKLVYLVDIFGAILEKKATTYTFRVYKHGPFSGEIYSDIERLVTLGLTYAEEMEKWTPEQERPFKYTITKQGIEKLEEIPDIPMLALKKRAVELALQAAGHLSGEKIRSLVYSEPNYIEATKTGFGSEIDPEYRFAVKFREIAGTIAREQFHLVLTGDEVSWLYLNFMKDIQFECTPLK